MVKQPEASGGIVSGPFDKLGTGPLARPPRPADWPPQVEMVISALEAGRFAQGRRERRAGRRRPLRVKALLRLFIDAPSTPPWTLYSRDVYPRGLGFVTPHCLPLGYGGLLELPAPDGQLTCIACTLLRCREAAPGWFEGAVYFNRDQPEFGAGVME